MNQKRQRRYLLLVLALILLLPNLADAQQLKFSWTHDGSGPPLSGFKLYRGTTDVVTNMTLVATINTPATRTFNYEWPAGATGPYCFALAAYNALGESTRVNKQSDGTSICLGKPVPPTGFSLVVQ